MKTTNIKLIATLFLSIVISSLYAQADWGTGNGKGFELPNTPYEIGTVDDLSEMFKDFSTIPATVTNNLPMAGNACFILTADIDMAGVPQTTSINAGGAFYGNIDGQGFVIKNLTINIAESQAKGAGFIAELQGTVKNIGFENLIVTATSQANYTGGIAGRVQGIAGRGINNCFIKGGTITGMQTTAGIAGWSGANDGVTNCFVDVDVIGTKNIAGIIGSAGCSVSNSAFYGSVKTTGGNPGGIIAIGAGAVTDCYYIAGFPAEGSASATPATTGGTELDDAAMALQASYTGFDFTTPIWKMVDGKAILSIADGGTVLSLTGTEAVTVELYPNPSTDLVTLVVDAASQLQVVSLAGVLVHEQALSVGKNIINLSGFASGYYFLSIFDGKNTGVKQLLIK